MRQSAKEMTILQAHRILLFQSYSEAISNTLQNEPVSPGVSFGLHAEQAKLFPRKTIR